MSNTIPQHVLDTAARIAKDPVKVAAYQTVTSNLPKLASLAGDLFGATSKPSGVQKLIGSIAATTGAGLLGAAGASLYNKLNKATTGQTAISQDEADKELGRLNARATFATSRSLLLTKHHDEVLKSLIKKDPLIKDADKDLVHSSFNTMAKFAPNLAADENAARSFLRTSIESGMGPSFATLQTLADAERSVQQAGGISLGGK